MNFKERIQLSWLAAIIAILGFNLPLVLADELSLMHLWLYTFISWLILIIWASLYNAKKK